MIFSSKQPVFNQFIYCYLNITVLSFYFIFEKRKPNFICSKCFLSFLIHIFMWLESKNRFYLLLETKEKKKNSWISPSPHSCLLFFFSLHRKLSPLHKGETISVSLFIFVNFFFFFLSMLLDRFDIFSRY